MMLKCHYSYIIIIIGRTPAMFPVLFVREVADSWAQWSGKLQWSQLSLDQID